MNSVEYLAHLDRLRATAAPGTLRAGMHTREGVEEAERQIKRGLSAWAITRYPASGTLHTTTIVFGTCASDARRRASAPARLGEEIHGEVTCAARIRSGWDAPIVWPFAAHREVARA